MRQGRNWQGALFCVGAGVAWELAARAQLLSPRLFPPLSDVISDLARLTISGVLPTALGETLLRMAIGLFAAAATMIPLGVWAGRSRRVWLTLAPTVESLRSLPPALAILPAMLFLGIGDSMKIFAIFFGAAFPILLNAMDGVQAIPKLFLDTAQTLRTGKRAMLFEVILPAAAPGMFAGLKTALPIAFIVAIISEMIGGTNGIGHFLLRSQRAFDIPGMYAATLALALAGGLIAHILNFIESLCLVWYLNWKRVSSRHNI